MTIDALKSLDDWRRKQDDLPGRPEAIRRLVDLGLKASPRVVSPLSAALAGVKHLPRLNPLSNSSNTGQRANPVTHF